ncbi:MAG: hypothetical protein CMH16_02110 [Methylobacterium sp.]|jgi:hypothetical protein|nr:hypothetical protein [Methylobacterium sp.]
MPVQYPSHLYIRIDRPLRADLRSAAEEAGQSVSAFARGVLRATLTERADAAPAGKAGVAWPTSRGIITQASDDGER